MKIKRGKFDIVINLLCLLILACLVIYLGINWNQFPAKIPGHYNALGEVDRWGSKGELVFLPVLAWLLYLLITALERYPQVWNTGVAVTEQNKERVYRTLKSMIGTLKLWMVVTFEFSIPHSPSRCPPGFCLSV